MTTKDKLADAIAQAKAPKGALVPAKKNMADEFDKSISESKEVIQFNEEQARFYLRTGNEKALKLRIEPISDMKNNPIYKERFQHGIYDPILLKAELAILNAHEGENQWLKGERFKVIRDSNIYEKVYGYKSFEAFIEQDTPYAKSTVYNWIKIVEKYTYEQSLKLGSKLSLITYKTDLKRDSDIDAAIKKIEKMSFRDTKAYLAKAEEDKPTMQPKDIQEDTFGAYTPPSQSSDIPTTSTTGKPDHYEPVEIDLVPAYVKGKALKSGEVKIDKSATEAMAKKQFPVLVGLDNEILQKYYIKAIQAKEGSIRSWIEAELAKTENKSDLKALKKIKSK